MVNPGAWHRFFCVTCQKEWPTTQRIYKTVYNGSTMRVKVMCTTCVAGKREQQRAPWVGDEVDTDIPANIVEAHEEFTHSADV